MPHSRTPAVLAPVQCVLVASSLLCLLGQLLPAPALELGAQNPGMAFSSHSSSLLLLRAVATLCRTQNIAQQPSWHVAGSLPG